MEAQLSTSHHSVEKIISSFLAKEAGVFGKKHRKGIAKVTPTIEKICVIYLYRNLLCLQSNASGNFLQKCINFVEQRLKFSHFKGSIIPQSIKNVQNFQWFSHKIKPISQTKGYFKS